LKTLPAGKFSPPTFALIWLPDAIPVAVRKPLQIPPFAGLRESKIVEDLPLFRLIRMGRFQQRFKPEDLPHQLTFILLSGEKLKCKSRRTFIFLSLFIS
jgi:hypothetical protein